MEREDGEMSDDNAMLVDEEPEMTRNRENERRTVLYKAEKDGVVVKQLEKVDAAKLEERAKRFGLNLTGNRVITQSQIDELYANSGVEGNERHFRFDAIYLNGVEGLTTTEIFEYLEDYKPLSLEWIDEVSCNVVCQDHISAALALLLHSREIKNEELKEMLANKSSHHWREGMPHPKKDFILMRFATNGEKKKLIKKPERKSFDEYDQSLNSISKNPWGDLCQTWGVYDHQEVFNRKLPKNDYEDEIEEGPRPPPIHIRNKRLAMRLGKRKQQSVESNTDDSSSDSEWKIKSKTPRMRMHADDEESKLKKKQTSTQQEEINLNRNQREKYAPLSIEVANTRSDHVNVKREPTRISDKFKFHGGNNKPSSVQSVRSRLGDKIASESEDSDQSSNESFEVNMTSRVQKVNSRPTAASSNVWSRLETKQNRSSSRSDLRQMLKSKTHIDKPKNTNDLRARIGKSKPSNLRIEIDNNHDSD